jgi:hypothetical protein
VPARRGVRRRCDGYVTTMSDHQNPDDERVAERAELLEAERAAGSDDPERQARIILEEGDERTFDRDAAPGSFVEHRTSDEATPPPD